MPSFRARSSASLAFRQLALVRAAEKLTLESEFLAAIPMLASTVAADKENQQPVFARASELIFLRKSLLQLIFVLVNVRLSMFMIILMLFYLSIGLSSVPLSEFVTSSFLEDLLFCYLCLDHLNFLRP